MLRLRRQAARQPAGGQDGAVVPRRPRIYSISLWAPGAVVPEEKAAESVRP